MLLTKRKLGIRRNKLLRGGEPTLSLAQAHELAETLRREDSSDPRLRNLADALSSANQVHALYGEPGLFQLIYFAMANSRDFDHFYQVLGPMVGLVHALEGTTDETLVLDNAEVPEGPDLRRFNSHVMMPSLSRKLYNPGRHHGYLVYGIGGPRILISLPFKGATTNNYDVYSHSVDVVTSLMTRGYHGAFLLLDNLAGLNESVAGVASWLLWFSLIAGHSDLVVFVRTEAGLTEGQHKEAEYTPDRVQKKIVDIPERELRWAEESEEVDSEKMIYFDQTSRLTRAEYLQHEASEAMPLVKQYSQPVGYNDGLVRFDAESGTLATHPFDYDVYA